MWAAWHAEGARAGGARRPARGGRALRARAERPQRRLLQRDVALAAEHARAAGATRRRWRWPAPPRRRWRGSATSARSEGVDAWFRRGGYLKVSTAAAHDDVWADALVAACRELGEAEAAQPLTAEPRSPSAAPRRPSAAAPSSRTRRPCSRRGWRSACASGCIAAGVEVFESSPVRALRRRAGRSRGADGRRSRSGPGAAVWRSAAPQRACAGRSAGRLSIASSHIVITEPVPDLLEEIGWTGGECITDSRALVDYFRTTPDGRIAFGWGGGRISLGGRLGGRAELDREVVARTIGHLGDFFPGLEGRRITHAWGGPIDASPTHLPLVHAAARRPRLRRRRLHRQRRRPLAHGRPHPRLAGPRPPRRAHSRLAFVDPSPPRVPPEPFHWLGGEAIRRGIMAKEEAQLAGREPGRLSSAVAARPRADRLPHRQVATAGCEGQGRPSARSARRGTAPRPVTTGS